MSDNKPDYAKFMRNQPEEIGKSSPRSGDLPRPQPAEDEDIPWAEIINEPEFELDYFVDSDSASQFSPLSAGPAFGTAPPIAVLAGFGLLVFLLLFHG